MQSLAELMICNFFEIDISVSALPTIFNKLNTQTTECRGTQTRAEVLLFFYSLNSREEDFCKPQTAECLGTQMRAEVLFVFRGVFM